MSTFYHDAIVDRSWRTLQSLAQDYAFTLIGGWATWLHTRAAKSTDIDIIVDFDTLSQLRQRYEVQKNDRLKKYEVHADGFDIDIYLPFYSTTLALPAEIVTQHAMVVDGFQVPPVEYLLALKLGAWNDRRASAKGQKDLLDIHGLIALTTRSRLGDCLDHCGISAAARSSLESALTKARKEIRLGAQWLPRDLDRNFDR